MNTDKGDLDPHGCIDRQNVYQLIIAGPLWRFIKGYKIGGVYSAQGRV